MVDPGFLEPMVRHFSRPDVFAVAPFMVLNGEPLRGRSVGRFRKGFMGIEILNDHPGRPANVLFAGGGAGMFRREMLINLGCFDRLYHPFYFEDVDLGYRAWKRGWVCISEPGSKVHHRHAGTIGRRFSKRQVYAIAKRNYILFHWKNIHDGEWMADHI
jgi:prepilin-type processing-associated H-X9-DG protein